VMLMSEPWGGGWEDMVGFAYLVPETGDGVVVKRERKEELRMRGGGGTRTSREGRGQGLAIGEKGSGRNQRIEKEKEKRDHIMQAGMVSSFCRAHPLPPQAELTWCGEVKVTWSRAHRDRTLKISSAVWMAAL